MKLFRIPLKPKGIIKDIPSSDTIFGAICWGIYIIYGEKKLTEILNNFDGSDKKFIPSSAFPLLNSENDFIYCLPKPIIPDPEIKEMEEIAQRLKPTIIQKAGIKIEEENSSQYSKRVVISQYKSFNKAKYLSESLFIRLIKGEKLNNLYQEYLKEELKIIQNDILLTSEEFNKIPRKKILELKTSARNKIDRLSFATVPGGEVYYEREIYFDCETFYLYFFLLTEDINFFIPIFRWLSDTGIGGNRTVGRGHYDILEKEIKEFSLPKVNNSNIFISLSKYLPADNEIDWQSEKNYYKLIPYQPCFDTMFFKGGGFIKKRITYLEEGSIFHTKEKKQYYGRLYPSAKFQNYTIYQCGLTIPVFIKMEGS